MFLLQLELDVVFVLVLPLRSAVWFQERVRDHFVGVGFPPHCAVRWSIEIYGEGDVRNNKTKRK